MTIIILALLATLTAAVGLPILFFALALGYAALDSVRELLKKSALDAVQIYAAVHNARLDVETRKEALDFNVLSNTAKLEQQRDYARLMIAQQRQKLIGSVPGEHSR